MALKKVSRVHSDPTLGALFSDRFLCSGSETFYQLWDPCRVSWWWVGAQAPDWTPMLGARLHHQLAMSTWIRHDAGTQAPPPTGYATWIRHDAGTQAPPPTGYVNLDQALDPFHPSASCATWRLQMTQPIGRIRHNWQYCKLCRTYVFLPTQSWLLFHCLYFHFHL